MFCNCVGAPDVRDNLRRAWGFCAVWHVDFEFRFDANHHPVPVCMYAFDELTGAEIFLRRDQLLTLKHAPFWVGPRDLMVAYAANAELSCFAVLGWPFPCNVLDLFVETIASINGRTDIWPQRGRPRLPHALELHGLPASSVETKDDMIDLILNNTDYTPEQWQLIETYNRGDVIDGTVPLLKAMAPNIDLPRALLRGRYVRAVTCQERLGLPVDTDYLARLVEHWERLQLHYIQRDDDFGLYEGTAFCEQRMWDLIEAKSWSWPHRTPLGRPKLTNEALGKQVRRYPELKRLVRLRDNIAELRISKLVNTVGADGFSRCPMLPFWTRTSRCQPSAEDKVFLPSLPAWLRGLLRPPPGFALVELDWTGQEYAIGAGFSSDPGMIADYLTGDPHWAFGVRSGLVPAGADKALHKDLRNKTFKPVVLGQNYGMTAYGIAAKTGRSLLWARDISARHRQSYPVFHRWLGDAVAQAKFDGVMITPFGWPMAVIAQTKHTTLLNYLAQASGADCMRIASIAAAEAGIRVCCSVHDSFWILAPLDELDATVAQMADIMRRAGAAVTGSLPIEIEVKATVRWPQNLGDCRDEKDQRMWVEVRELMNGGLMQQARG
jgi:DNA polymerase I